MTSGLNATAPSIVAAFKAALLHQGLIVLALVVLVLVAWRAFRLAELRRAAPAVAGRPGSPGRPAAMPTGAARLAGSRGRTSVGEPAAAAVGEAPGRRAVRIGFGLLWLLDGLLQAQAAMPLGLPSQVIRPVAATTPLGFQHFLDGVLTVWTLHPVTAAAAAVWIQLGLGAWLLVAPRGRWSRLAGAGSALWGLGVWVFGEALGGLLSPGSSFLFGLPGAALFYVVAGILVALPERAWVGRRLGRLQLGLLGALFVAMATLQAVPGRGFWSGRLVGRQADGTRLGTLADMVHQMAATPQPPFLVGWLKAFAGFDAGHGFAVNLFVVLALALVGGGLLSGRARPVRIALAGATVVCLAAWVLVQDLGFLGGLGTDPNSMIPVLVLLLGGEQALEAPLVAVPTAEAVPAEPWRARAARWSERLGRQPSYGLRLLAALAAVAVVLLGAVPMAMASMNPKAAPIVARSLGRVSKGSTPGRFSEPTRCTAGSTAVTRAAAPSPTGPRSSAACRAGAT